MFVRDFGIVQLRREVLRRCRASCIFCVYLSMRMVQNTKLDSLGNSA
jgi:hypothetical protein